MLCQPTDIPKIFSSPEFIFSKVISNDHKPELIPFYSDSALDLSPLRICLREFFHPGNVHQKFFFFLGQQNILLSLSQLKLFSTDDHLIDYETIKTVSIPRLKSMASMTTSKHSHNDCLKLYTLLRPQSMASIMT